MGRSVRGAVSAARAFGTGAGVLAAAVGIVAVSALAGAGVLAIIAKFARTIVAPPAALERVRVLGVDADAGTITLSADPDTRTPGRYSFWFDGGRGHARVGEIVAETASTVTRRLIQVDFGDPASARRGRISGWYYLGPWELGLPYTDVTVDTALGPAPAWLVPADDPGGRWVVMVHGWSVRRQECVRAIETFHRAGYTCLLISYRNDGEAPDTVDRRYGLGATEWPDVAAAIAYAVDHGAADVVLAGWSMGGAIALQTALRSPLAAERVSGLVLDSPAVDWHDILGFQGRLNKLPDAITAGVVDALGNHRGRALTGLAAPIDFGALDVLGQADRLATPTLILHSDADGFVPGAGSYALAALRPDLVTLDRWTGARHAKLWNYDPERWDRVVGDWLTARVRGESAPVG